MNYDFDFVDACEFRNAEKLEQSPSAEIRAAIYQANTSQRAIADYLGVSPTTMSQVISGRTRSARVEAEINKICGRVVFAAPRPAHRPRSSYNGIVQVSA